MLILQFFRFLTGYVSFTAQGGFPERFINLCCREKIVLWNLTSKNGVITACAANRHYKKIRLPAKRSGMTVRIKQKHGVPIIMKKHKRRAGLLVGLAVAVALLVLLSTRVWSIDVTGNETTPTQTIIGVFEALGVRKGAKISDLDVTQLEIAATAELDSLVWLNINIDGSAVIIEVRERQTAQLEEKPTQPADIVAAHDGQIVVLRPFAGTPIVGTGQAVLKGDLIISGVVENKDLTTSFCAAEGYVVAKTRRKITAQSPPENSFDTMKLMTKRYRLSFLNFDFSLGKTDVEGSSRQFENTSYVTVGGVTLPLGLTTVFYYCAEDGKSVKNSNLIAVSCFFAECRKQLSHTAVTACDVNVAKEKGISVSGTFDCLENIAQRRTLMIEQTVEETEN